VPITGEAPRPHDAEQSQQAVRALLGRGSIYGIASAVQGATLFVLLPVATRLLPPSEYGTVAVALVLQTVLSVVAGAGLPEVLSRIYFLEPFGPRRARGGVVVAIAIGVGAAALADALGAMWSEPLLGIPYSVPLRLAVWSSAVLVAVLASQAVLRASSRSSAYVTVAACANPGGHVLGLILCASWRADATSYLLGNMVALVLAGVLGTTWVGIARRPLQVARADLALSIPTVPFALGLYLLWGGDRAVIARLDGVDAAGRYQVAYLVGGFVLTLASAVYNAWVPVVYGAADDHRWDVLADTAALLYRLGGFIGGAIAILAALVLSAVAPPQYDPHELVVVSAVVTTAVVPFVASLAYLLVLLWYRRTVTLSWTMLSAAGVNILLNIVLVPRLGLVGAASATVVSYTLLALLLWSRARTFAAVPSGRQAIAAGAATAAAAAALSVALPDDAIATVIRVAAACLLLLLALRLIRTVTSVRHARR
jgi:O-antigen/teichoic acid export membrane protein